MEKIKYILPAFRYFVIIIIIVGLYKLSGCGWNDPCYRNLGTHTTNIIRVDQAILTQTTINPNESIGVRLWDTVGTNAGYTFKGIQMSRSQFAVDLTLKNALDIDCGTTVKDTVITMVDYVFTISPPFNSGPNSVNIHQPDGSVLNRPFTVR